MKTLEELQTLDKNELKAYAFEDLGLELKGNFSEETLIERIVEKQTEIQREQEALNNPVLRAESAPAPELDEHAKETKDSKSVSSDLEAALKDQIARGLGFEHDGVAWTMSYRGQVISGNLSVPTAIVVRTADVLLNRR